MPDPAMDDAELRLQALRELSDPSTRMAQTVDMLLKAQQQIAQTVQQVSTLAVQVHQDLARIEQRVAQLEAQSAEPKCGRRGRGGKKKRKGR